MIPLENPHVAPHGPFLSLPGHASLEFRAPFLNPEPYTDTHTLYTYIHVYIERERVCVCVYTYIHMEVYQIICTHAFSSGASKRPAASVSSSLPTSGPTNRGGPQTLAAQLGAQLEMLKGFGCFLGGVI